VANGIDIVIGIQTLSKYLSPTDQVFGSYTGQMLRTMNKTDISPEKIDKKDF
jgi:hypothetical protein